MKKYVCTIGIIALIIVSVFSSCKKYEEDYGIMWKSPKGRLVGTWKVAQIDSDTMSIKMSEFSALGELQMTFEKDGTGSVKFKDNGLGEMLSSINWEEMLAEVDDTSEVQEYGDAMQNIDLSSILSTETKFNWAFDDKKEHIKLSFLDATTNSYSEDINMKILSLCKSDCKFRYEEESTMVDVSMQK